MSRRALLALACASMAHAQSVALRLKSTNVAAGALYLTER